MARSKCVVPPAGEKGKFLILLLKHIFPLGFAQGEEPLLAELKVRKYDAIVIGFGERGDDRPDQTASFESEHEDSFNTQYSLRACHADNRPLPPDDRARDGTSDKINLLRETVPKMRILFNYSPTSTLWAVQRNYPLGNCRGKPGKNYVGTRGTYTDNLPKRITDGPRHRVEPIFATYVTTRSALCGRSA